MYLALESEFQDYTTTDDIDLVNNIFKNTMNRLESQSEKKITIAIIFANNYIAVKMTRVYFF